MPDVRAALVTVLATVLLCACAQIPTSGPIRGEGGDLRLERPNVAVPFIAEKPTPGASAEDVVRGFLRASADFRNDHAIARLYLSPQARQRWRPGAGTTVYDRAAAPLTVGAEAGGTVTVRGSQVATIDPDGSYRRTPEGSEVTRAFGMARVDGEWRIGSLDNGLLLSLVDVEESFRQVALYFLSPYRNTLVPDVVLLPELPGLSTKLVARLLRGPTVPLRGAVRTAFPQGTSLEVQSVPVVDGLATVRLDETALGADEDAREQMSAQIVWTLKQLGTEIQRIEILAGGEALVVSGVPQELPRESWLTFNPDGQASSPSVYAVRDGAVGRVIEGRFGPVAGPAGTGTIALRTPAVSLDASRLAAVGADRRAVYAGRPAADAAFEPVLTGGELSQPSWDPLGNLWVVDRSTGALLLLPDGAAEAVQVQVPKLAGGAPTQVSVSRDGARVALVSGSGRSARLVVGAVAGVDRLQAEEPEAAGVAVTSTWEVLPDLRGVRDVTWADARTLSVLGSRATLPVAPIYTSVDGYDVEEVEPADDLVTLAVAPPLEPRTTPLVVGTADGQLRQFTTSRGWVTVGPGADPTYPGG
jgi:hypothetical protein